MMEIAIREATIADVDRIARLVGDLGYPTSSRQMHIRMAAIFGDEDGRCYTKSLARSARRAGAAGEPG